MAQGNLQLESLSDTSISGTFASIFADSESLYVKKLSRNDKDWADDPGKHQGGVYVPPRERDSGFFPALVLKQRSAEGDDIFEAFFDISWPDVNEIKRARLVNYTSKGAETHLTRVPKPLFKGLTPASLLVIGKKRDKYFACTIDSENSDYEVVRELLLLPPDYSSGLFNLVSIKTKRREQTLSFVEEALKAFQSGRIADLSSKYSSMPTTAQLASKAREIYLNENNLVSLDPFVMDAPGDALLHISRKVEYDIFRDAQMRARAIDLVRLLFGDDPSCVTIESALRAVIDKFSFIDALLLSAAQQRKSRAGYSFEHHIEAMLTDGRVPFAKQVIIEAKKRPDFVLPTTRLFKDQARKRAEALVLSAKTTLRERWKQVSHEMTRCSLFLATVDETIAANAIEDMACIGIRLVVPESLKVSNVTVYSRHSNVLSFKQFFEERIAKRYWPRWVAKNIVPPR